MKKRNISIDNQETIIIFYFARKKNVEKKLATIISTPSIIEQGGNSFLWDIGRMSTRDRVVKGRVSQAAQKEETFSEAE